MQLWETFGDSCSCLQPKKELRVNKNNASINPLSYN